MKKGIAIAALAAALLSVVYALLPVGSLEAVARILFLTDQGELRFFEDSASGTNFVTMKAPATLAGDLTWQLPSSAGSASQVLQTDGAGVLSWATPTAVGLTWVSVKDHGALGNDSNNDTEEITAAITAAGEGGVIYFPKGTYRVTQLSIPTTGQMWLGMGPDKTLIKQFGAAATTDCVITDSSSGAQDGAIVRDLAIQGQADGGNLLHIRQMKGGLFENLFLVQPGANLAAIRVRDSSNKLTFSNVRFQGGNSNAGIKCFWIGDSADGGSPLTTNIWISDCYSKAIGATEKFTGEVFFLDTTAGVTVKNCKFEGVKSTPGACRIVGGRQHLFENVGFESTTPGDVAIEWLFDATQRIYLKDCAVSNEPTTGMDVTGGTSKVYWQGGFIDNDIDIDTGSRWVTFDDFDERPGYAIAWTGASPGTARATTRIGRTAKYNSSNALQVGWRTGEEPRVYEFRLSGTVQNAANQVFDDDPHGFNAPLSEFDGQIVGIQLETSSARTAGTLTAKVRANSVVLASVAATLDTTNTLVHRTFSYDLTNNDIQMGEPIEVLYDSASAWETAAGFASTNLRVLIFVQRFGRTE